MVSARISAQAPNAREERRGEFAATLEQGSLRIGIDCAPAYPCNARFGSVVRGVKGVARIKPVAPTSGPVFIYVDSSGELVAGSPVTLQCEGCRYARGVTQFPASSIPLYSWAITKGVFDQGSSTDFRAMFARTNIAAGPGVTVAENAGTATLGIDPALVSTRVIVPPKTSSSACSSGQFSFDANYYYVCVAANQWKRFALSVF
ncbi:MAG: hypothetical protein JOZ22_06455 [Acidobacteriia bacterium]|nr:hypothetical protein [Terriglobia bacterium]